MKAKHLPEPFWCIVTGDGSIAGKNKTLRGLLRDTTLDGTKEVAQMWVVAPSGMKLHLDLFITPEGVALTKNLQ